MKRSLMKLSAVILFAFVLILVFAGCGEKKQAVTQKENTTKADGVNKSGFPIVSSKITLKGFARKDAQNGDFDKMLLWQEVERLTNVHIEWDTPGQQNITEKVNLLLASGDLPDFFIKGVITNDQLATYGPQGTFKALENLIEEYAPNFKEVLRKFPEIKPQISAPDGHVYGLPRIMDSTLTGVPRFPLINTKWLGKLGIKAPTTSEELMSVLIAFRDKDPNSNGKNDEIPYSAHNFEFAMRGLEGMFGLERQFSYKINVKDGKAQIWYASDKYKELLKYLNGLYKEKLIDIEIFTQNDKLYFGKLSDDKVGYTPLLDPKSAGKYADDFNIINPPKGPYGDQLWNLKNSNFSEGIAKAVISKSNNYPEATMRLFDYFYGDEGATLLYMGKEGETCEKGTDGLLHYKNELLNSQKGFTLEIGERTIWPGGHEFGYYTDKQLRPTKEGTQAETFFKQITPFVPKKIYDLPLLEAKKQERLTSLRNNLDTYVNEMAGKFVLGDASFNEWDNYVKTVDKMGIKELEGIYQEAFNKILGSK